MFPKREIHPAFKMEGNKMSALIILLIIIFSPFALVCGIISVAILYGIVYCLLEAVINAVKEVKYKLEDKSG